MDFESDTRVEEHEGHYRANLSRAWEIWGPNGGYLATIALRAAGRAARIQRPAAIYCHFIRTARFDGLDLAVSPVQLGRNAESIRVSATQDGKPVLEALVRTAAELPGLEHDEAKVPVVPPPEALLTADELHRPGDPRFAFWNNIEARVIDTDRFRRERSAKPAHWLEWYRFRPTATFADPFVDAGRALVLIDTLSWPAVWLRHPEPAYIAPSLDVAVFFHRPARHSPWLLAEQQSPVAAGGLIGGTGAVFDREGRLVASGGAQLLCVPPP
ncbi:MAG TPA: thioesterase family protein [Polyangiaceae bacterium]|nr:thioesterase family protein [Polyangiaceae bacterium]